MRGVARNGALKIDLKIFCNEDVILRYQQPFEDFEESTWRVWSYLENETFQKMRLGSK